MNSNGGSSFFGSDWLGAFLIIAILFGGGLGWGGGGRGPMPMPDVATKDFVQDAVNNQSLQQGQKEILLSSERNNLETYKAVNEQTGALQQQMFTHQLQEENRFGELRAKMDQLGFQMESCCCSIKTQMLQDKYDALLEKYNSERIDNSNQQQTYTILNTLLSTMGKWVANAPAAAA